MSLPIDAASIRRRAEAKVAQRIKFFRNVVGYLSTNVLLWGIWLFTSSGRGGVPWPLFVTFFWGISIASDAIKLFVAKDWLENYTQRELELEIAREEARLGVSKEKRKRGNVQLGDDGELIEIDDQPLGEPASKRLNGE